MTWDDIEGIRGLLAKVPFEFAEPIMLAALDKAYRDFIKLALAPVENPLN
jgi:hypothetical protein